MSLEHYVALNMMQDIGPVRVRGLMETLGSLEAIFAAPAAELAAAPRMGLETARRFIEQRKTVNAARELDRAEALGLRVLCPLDEAYPEALKQIHDPPLALYVKGTLTSADRHGIAVIGTRRCSHYGRQAADRLAFQLAKQGYTVVSGLARGIDTAAHEGALKGGGRTLAVLGSGMDCLYPAENAALAEKISGQGALLSEFPLGTAPGRTTFPMRNRIVSGLSKGVLVVEASKESGTMITVDEATSQGRLIFAVPGRIDSPGSAGCHQLIQNGAKLVTDVDDITTEFEYLIPPNPAGREDPEVARAPLPPLSDEETRVLGLLEAGGMLVDELIRASTLPSSRVSSLLIGLEMKRRVRMLPGRVVQAL